MLCTAAAIHIVTKPMGYVGNTIAAHLRAALN